MDDEYDLLHRMGFNEAVFATMVRSGGLGCTVLVQPGPHRARQRFSGPVCDRPSASRPVPSRQNRLQRRLGGFDGTGRNGTGRDRTVANRAGTALTDTVRTGIQSQAVGSLPISHFVQIPPAVYSIK